MLTTRVYAETFTAKKDRDRTKGGQRPGDEIKMALPWPPTSLPACRDSPWRTRPLTDSSSSLGLELMGSNLP